MNSYWSAVINLISITVQNYLLDPYAVCLLWNQQYDIELQSSSSENLNPLLIMNLDGLNDSLQSDVYNFSAKKELLESSGLVFDDLVLKLIGVFESSFCETFIAFGDDVEVFLRAYRNASMIPDKYIVDNHFIFGYNREVGNLNVENRPFTEAFLKDQPRILIIETDTSNSSVFTFKTNRFVGSRDSHPEELYELNHYDAEFGIFLETKVDLFPNKMIDQKGREIILGVFDYRPFVAVDYDRAPNVRDRSSKNPKRQVYIDGTEIRLVTNYCDLYNCTVVADTSEDVWGFTYPNMSGYGARYALMNQKVDMIMDANYFWITFFIDQTHYTGFTATTLLVPKPLENISWTLPLRPFQFTLWLGISVYLLVEAISLLFTRKAERKIWQNEGENSWLASVTFGYSTALKLFVSQSSGYNVTSGSLRTLLFACYMNDIIITSIYGGGLASILTLPTVGEAPDTVDRIIKFNLHWAATDTAWLEPYTDLPKGSRGDRFVSLFRQNTVDELRDMAEHGYYGFIVERMMGKHFANIEFLTFEGMDRLKLMIEDLSTAYTTFFVPRGWAMEEQFNSFIMNWHAGGLGDFWEWKMASDYLNQNLQGRIESSKYLTETTGPVKLDIKQVAGIMLIVLVGSLLSILVFLLEILQKKCDVLGKLKRIFFSVLNKNFMESFI